MPQTLAMLIAVMSMIAPSEITLAQQPTANRPNIILCMADDQGWSEVGYNGHDCLQTPVMDEMARVGFRFDKFYTAAPNCGPTRGSIMTGRNATRFGQFAPTWAMRPEEITIAEILKDRGHPNRNPQTNLLKFAASSWSLVRVCPLCYKKVSIFCTLHPLTSRHENSCLLETDHRSRDLASRLPA